MRYYQFVPEARRNPDQNKKTNTQAELEAAAAQYGTDNVFVRYTTIHKFGINPNPSYSTTPLGIYGYPLEYVLDMGVQNLPYRGDAPFVWVFKYTGDPSTLLHIGGEDLDPSTTDRIIENLKNLLELKGISELYIDEMLEDSQPWDEDEEELTRDSPVFMMTLLKWYYTTDDGDQIIRLSTSETRRILTMSGITGIVDNDGAALIHNNESTQAVFFDFRQLKVLKLINNTVKDVAGQGADLMLTRAKKFGKTDLSPDEMDTLLQSPLTAFKYAVEVLKAPWPEGEPVIKTNPKLWDKYQEIFKLGDKPVDF